MKSGDVRKAVFAGSWYPADAAQCEREIQGFLAEGQRFAQPSDPPVGGIVPHAGWYFSGSIACNVIHCLAAGEKPDVVALFGMHLPPGGGCFMMPEGRWQTPFGEIPVATEVAGELAQRFSFTLESPASFNPDNTVELQLPFIKYFFPEVRIVAMGVPPDKQSLAIGQALVEISKPLGLHLAVIGSTDLTHYGTNYGFMARGTGRSAVDWVRNENDRRIIDTMLRMEPERVITEALEHQNACCSGAAATALAAGRALGAEKATQVAYATSYDKSPGDSFVGYVGIVF